MNETGGAARGAAFQHYIICYHAHLEKQYQKYSRKDEGYELKQRLTQALARKGYDYSDISTALREFL